VQLIVDDRNRAGMVGFGMSEENVERSLAHPLSVVCSDGGASANPNPEVKYQYSLGTEGEGCGGGCTTGYCCKISIQ
jgi:hypothetical protein